jgi:hypothetical protein
VALLQAAAQQQPQRPSAAALRKLKQLRLAVAHAEAALAATSAQVDATVVTAAASAAKREVLRMRELQGRLGDVHGLFTFPLRSWASSCPSCACPAR